LMKPYFGRNVFWEIFILQLWSNIPSKWTQNMYLTIRHKNKKRVMARKPYIVLH
jgi:hypothetical protein